MGATGPPVWSEPRRTPEQLADAAKQWVRAAGGELKALYVVTGQYDAVAIAELPNDEAVARVALANGSMGNVRTEPLRGVH
jgi:uncharacterized protein with GYD domain